MKAGACRPAERRNPMENTQIETPRLILRRFEEQDLDAVYLLFSDGEVNTFLPWFPVKDRDEAREFLQARLRGKYCYAICRRQDGLPIGYLHTDEDDSHDFGYALRKEYWHQGIVSEAGAALIERLKADGLPYITATHDRNNPRSGAVMRRLGMRYCYSYKEQWQPKDFPVVFRMYQLNFDCQKDRVYPKYWDLYSEHWIEPGV